MKRGFLNTKKAKEKLACDDGASTAQQAPPKILQPPDKVAEPVSRPKKISEPVVGTMIKENIPANADTLEPYGVVRIPSLKLTKSTTTCIIRSSTCGIITNTPGYYTPPPPQNLTDVVFAKNTANMGVGLFAKSSAKVHQVVFSERPLLIFPRGLPLDVVGLSKEKAIERSHLAFEDIIRQAVGVMAKEDAKAYLSLSNCFSNSPHTMYGIARTNAFGTGSDIEEEDLDKGRFGYAAVGNLVSRINHSCMPNVRVDFDIPTFSLQVIAKRAIKAGEQLFYCYCEPNRSVKERRRQLATYGFVCRCKACVNATPERDKLREELDDRLGKVIDESESMFSNPRFGIRSLNPLLKLEKDIVNEGLDAGQKFVDLLSVILHAYTNFNNVGKRIEYSNKVKKYTGQTN